MAMSAGNAHPPQVSETGAAQRWSGGYVADNQPRSEPGYPILSGCMQAADSASLMRGNIEK